MNPEMYPKKKLTLDDGTVIDFGLVTDSVGKRITVLASKDGMGIWDYVYVPELTDTEIPMLDD